MLRIDHKYLNSSTSGLPFSLGCKSKGSIYKIGLGCSFFSFSFFYPLVNVKKFEIWQLEAFQQQNICRKAQFLSFFPFVILQNPHKFFLPFIGEIISVMKHTSINKVALQKTAYNNYSIVILTTLFFYRGLFLPISDQKFIQFSIKIQSESPLFQNRSPLLLRPYLFYLAFNILTNSNSNKNSFFKL